MSTEWKIRQEICEIGRRVYAKGFASGHDGNISYRLSKNEVLCSPTQISKGFMKEDDLCVVDLDGNQLRGKRARTSEILLHLEIYKGDPNVKSVVHCHPPHATAFAVARVDLPSCVLPEIEILLGAIPRADYETPGGKSFAETILPFVGQGRACILSNHGTVSWGDSVEKAYWYTEMLDGYCRILLLANQLGHIERLPGTKMNELLEIKQRGGYGNDPRRDARGEICVNPAFGISSTPAADLNADRGHAAQSVSPELVEAITEEVLKALQRR